MADGDDPTEDLVRRLQDAVGRALGDADVAVSDVRRLSGGASRETWSFTALGPVAGRRPLILQRLRPGGVGTGPSMEVEDRLLAAAGAGGVPVPPVVVAADEAEAAGLGAARVSAHVAGEALGPRLVRAERTEEGRRTLARQLGAALAGIHRIDPASASELEVVDPLARVRGGLDLLGEHRPALELGLRRLEATRPEPAPVAVVHGDFRIGNLLVDGDDLTAVLDWELAHRGDPAEDLGWLCGRAWRFGGEREAGGVADLDDVLAGYVEAGGRPTSPEVVRWWTAAGTLLWGLICAVQARRHLDGHVRSVELATIGRRVCEAEYDLLDLVLPRAAPDASDRPGPDRDPPGPDVARDGDATDPAGAPMAGPDPGALPAAGDPHPGEAPAPDRSPSAAGAAPGPGEGPGEERSPDQRPPDERPTQERPADEVPAPPDLHGRPTAAELVDAVRSHLAEDLGPALEGSARFHARVAANALGVVERELRLGPAQAVAHARRLDALGVPDDATLARRIRAGDLDDRPDVDAAVRAAVVDRLRVAHPDWLHPPDR